MNTQTMSPVTCPQCRQSFMAPVEQILDAGRDPDARNRLLSGQFNLARCPRCGYYGPVPMPVVYHDPKKELFLVHVPVEVGLQGRQERIIGDLTNRVINALPPEKRKAYLLQPKTMLSLQNLVDTVLEAEGITKEMLAEQRSRVELLQRLLTADERTLEILARENDAKLDALFFQMLAVSAEGAMAEGQQQAAEQVLQLRDRLIPLATFGQRIQAQQQAIAGLQAAAAQGLTPELLLNHILQAPNEAAVEALVAVGRPTIDYQFYMNLAERIGRAEGSGNAAEAERLKALREQILNVSEAVDRQNQAIAQQAAQLLREILTSPDPAQAIQEHLPEIDDTFMMVLTANLEAAERNGQADLAARLRQVSEQIMTALQAAAPPEVQFINQLLMTDSESDRWRMLKERQAEVTPQLLELMTVLKDDLRDGGRPEAATRLEEIRRQAEKVLGR